MKSKRLINLIIQISFIIFIWSNLAMTYYPVSKPIPLPEHPRPDFQRTNWQNLNGTWEFKFDPENVGLTEKWFEKATEFPEKILVPFPWGSPLSGVENQADLAWYRRSIQVPASWQGQQIFLVVGASDWHTTGWLDGKPVGEFRGGYTPFEFELTPHVKFGQNQTLVLRVDDTKHEFKLFGKQGYGDARGLWQTVYLEARPATALATIYFTPDIDRQLVQVKAVFNQPAPAKMNFQLQFKTGELAEPKVVQSIKPGARSIEFEVKIPNPHLWSLEDPFLYEVDAILTGGKGQTDPVATYFGMRKISVMNLPGTDFPYIALNNQPLYLELTLDQAYHPDGFYTYPSDEFMRDDILRTRQIGLNGQRIHVKIDLPRKLYWADRLGVLIMADIPNSWGQPDAEMRHATETALRGMIQRDYNHPAIFSWVLFNETWGLVTRDNEQRKYLPETQRWVEEMVRLAKKLDPSRLVEDNSPCNNDHVVTDINSWHAYLPGYAWQQHLTEICQQTFPGSNWNFVPGKVQGKQPNLNSECGNVWGYKGSTGDVDWSWDYHLMLNAFRRHPQICGWLYTEHHDVINEWNGYYRYDRSDKITGLGELVPGMNLNDWHAPFYLALGEKLCQEVQPGATVEVPVWASFLTNQSPGPELQLQAELVGWNSRGDFEHYFSTSRAVPFAPWLSRELAPLAVKMPAQPALAVLRVVLKNTTGTVLHRNFTTFLVTAGALPSDEIIPTENGQLRILRLAPNSFHQAEWSLKQWQIFDGLKVNGTGAGFFEYHLPWPDDLKVNDLTTAAFRAELSAKQLFGKDRAEGELSGDYMRGKGTHDPSRNPNAYPMTDETTFDGAVRIRVNGEVAGVFELADDPADHRGLLSWYAQKPDRTLHEAGSYGYLISATIPPAALEKAARAGEFVLRLEVDPALPTGLAIYGERFGRFPVAPCVILGLP